MRVCRFLTSIELHVCGHLQISEDLKCWGAWDIDALLLFQTYVVVLIIAGQTYQCCYWQNGGCYFEVGSIRECGRSVHGLWKSTCSICYSEVTYRVGRMLGFFKAWQIVSQQARLHAICYLLSSGEPVVTRFVTPCSTCFKGYECSICKPQTIFLYKFVECGDMGQGTLVQLVW